MNREEAKATFVIAVNEIELQSNTHGFVWDLPSVGQDEEGNEFYELNLSSNTIAHYSFNCLRKFELIAGWLVSIDGIKRKYAFRDVLLFTMRQATNCVNKSTSDIENKFIEIRDFLKREIPPLLTVVPVKGIFTSKVLTLNSVIIGMLSEELELCINEKCMKSGMPAFSFTDEVVWTEDYLAWRVMLSDEEEDENEIDISDLPILMAIWTHQHGDKSVEKVYQYIELLSSAVGFLQFNNEVAEYRSPDILSISDYCAIYQDQNLEHGFDSQQFLIHSPVNRRAKREFIKLNKSDVDLDVFSLEDLDIISRMFRTLEGDAHAWEMRFARFLHWFHVGNKSETISNSMVSFSIALECLVSPVKASENVSNSISERVAFLYEDQHLSEKISIYKNIKRLYDKRSRVTHGQELMTFESDAVTVKEMISILFDIGQKFLKCAINNDWNSEQDMDFWFEQKKFS